MSPHLKILLHFLEFHFCISDIVLQFPVLLCVSYLSLIPEQSLAYNKRG